VAGHDRPGAGDVVSPRERVGVIGGGLGGLAAAVTLAARGHDVVLFERGATLGGKTLTTTSIIINASRS
jgi:predicted NAD/FAD-binding protein